MNFKLPYTSYEKLKINEADFNTLSVFVTANYGIRLPKEKLVMVEGRLQKRLRATNSPSFKEYLEMVFGESGKEELVHMIDAISTNKTDFYRESAHFDFMTNEFLPEFVKGKNHPPLSIWSAAASTGEEIYTLSMVLEEYNLGKTISDQVNYSILGSDISVEALKQAVSGIYKYERISDVSFDLRNRYFLKSKDKEANTVRVKSSLRNKTSFKRVNLMDDAYEIDKQFDIIFCRNVLIYFNKENQEKVINKLCVKLKPGGYFFLGHSESILGKKVPLTPVLPTIYKRI